VTGRVIEWILLTAGGGVLGNVTTGFIKAAWKCLISRFKGTGGPPSRDQVEGSESDENLIWRRAARFARPLCFSASAELTVMSS
jgi:hypothetical protein